MDGASILCVNTRGFLHENPSLKWQGGHFSRAFRGSAGPYPLHCFRVRPFDLAQGPRPPATATPPLQSRLGFDLLRDFLTSRLSESTKQMLKQVQHGGYKKMPQKNLHLSPKRSAYIWMKITVNKRIWVLRALALSRAQGKGEVWRGKNCGLRTLSGFSPSKLGGPRDHP